MTALNGWHPGERSIHQKLGFAEQVATHYTEILADLPPDHAQFYETCLPFIPVTTLDELGRPWGSLIAGKNGEKGFIRSRQPTQLQIKARLWDGDPIGDNLRQFDKVGKLLISGLGVEFSTRRRNKFVGAISKIRRSNQDTELELLVNQAVGHCPKYLNLRDFDPRTERKPKVVYDERSLSVEDRLPDDVIEFILSCDTAFIGTSYVATPENAELYPSHVAMNHRGGLPGFVRVRKDGRTLVLPDFRGNRMMSSMGNIECTPLASLTFVNFETGNILYLTGGAKNLIGSDAHDIMPFQNQLVLIHTTGYVFVHDALPIRQKADTVNIASPYSPPLRLLAEEASMTLFGGDDRPDAMLTQITLHDPQIATFTWETSKPLNMIPGQAVILDCTPFMTTHEYRPLVPINPDAINDDNLRTWTIATSSPGPTCSFSITLRHKTGGALTSALFDVAKKLRQLEAESLHDTRSINLTVKIAGITGEFILPKLSPSIPRHRHHLVWFAGGIGLTPFLSMLDFLRYTVKDEKVDIRFVLSTREPKILLPLIFQAYSGHGPTAESTLSPRPNPNIRLRLNVFHSQYKRARGLLVPKGVVLQQHARRLDAAYIERQRADISGKDVYVCGPEGYMQTVIRELTKAGVEPDHIKTEAFSY